MNDDMGSIGVENVMTDISKKLDKATYQMTAKFNYCAREIKQLKARVLCLDIICVLLAIEAIILGYNIWK